MDKHLACMPVTPDYCSPYNRVHTCHLHASHTSPMHTSHTSFLHRAPPPPSQAFCVTCSWREVTSHACPSAPSPSPPSLGLLCHMLLLGALH